MCNLDSSCGFLPFFTAHCSCRALLYNHYKQHHYFPKNKTKNFVAHIFSKITTYFLKLLFDKIDYFADYFLFISYLVGKHTYTQLNVTSALSFNGHGDNLSWIFYKRNEAISSTVQVVPADGRRDSGREPETCDGILWERVAQITVLI